MNLHEAVLFAAFYLRRYVGRDVAVLIKKDGTVGGWAKEQRHHASSWKSPAVIAMQGLATRGIDPSDYFLYTTYVPTHMCVAMGVRCHVTHVIFYDVGASALRCREPRGALAPAGPLPPLLTAMPGTVWEADPAAGYSVDHFLASLANNQVVPRLDADYMVHIDQGMDAALMLNEFEPQDAAHAMFPIQSLGGNGMTPLQQRIYMATALAMLDLRRCIAVEPGQAIAALLVGPTGKILSFGINTNEGNITRHAEVNCLQTYEAIAGAQVPDDAVLFSTLRSCDMCSGMLTTMARRITVFYAEPDPGVLATTLSTNVNGSREAHCIHRLSTNAHLRWMGVRAALPMLAQGRFGPAKTAYHPIGIKLVRKTITAKLLSEQMVRRFEREFQAVLDLGDPAAEGSDAEYQTWVHCTDFLVGLLRGN